MSLDNVYDLESLFIEKLSEKYTLNKKDLKKAFMRFDHDGNGLLDLTELGEAVRVFISGVTEQQVENLMAAYDTNGDGKISYEELLHNLTSRDATKEEKMTPRSNMARMKKYEDKILHSKETRDTYTNVSLNQEFQKLDIQKSRPSKSVSSIASDEYENDREYSDISAKDASSLISSAMETSSIAASNFDASDPHQVRCHTCLCKYSIRNND